jgi:DNA topoisomerase-6 subunit B
VASYLEQTAIANPHVSIHYRGPEGARNFLRVTEHNPPLPVRIKPHPHGVELGRLIAMLRDTQAKHLSHFLRREFCRVGAKTAADILQRAGDGLTARSYPKRIAHAQARALHRALEHTRVSAPPTAAIVPIGEQQLIAGLKRELGAGLYLAHTRPPAVYRGNPFQVEVAIAYDCPEAGATARLLRYANRVPLLFQQGECAITKAVSQTHWQRYGIAHQQGNLPNARMAILAHVASVWVPFTSESKQAIACYDEIVREFELALQHVGRDLGAHVHRTEQRSEELGKRRKIESYLPHIRDALSELLALDDDERVNLMRALELALDEQRG